MTSENKPWVDEFLIPLDACESAIRFANTFDGPQSAWLGWKKPAELLWTLFKAGVDRRKILACLVEIIERVVPIYEKEFPGDTRIRKAVEAVRRCSEDDSKENRDAAADAAADAASYAAVAMAADAAGYDDIYIDYIVSSAALSTTYAVMAAEDHKTEREGQLACIRRHFAVSPFVKGYEA